MSDASRGRPEIEWGVAAATRPGEVQSGDRHLVHLRPSGTLLGVVDGLGHGDGAASAAVQAAATIERHPDDPVVALMQRCHAALVGTRGVVMSLAVVDTERERLTWLAVGNVEGIVVHADGAHERLLNRGGVLGLELPPLRPHVTSLAAGDVLVLATDGIDPRFVDHRLDAAGSPQTMADELLTRFGTGTDDALVLVVRVGAVGNGTG